MGTIDAYIPMDRRQALGRNNSLPDRTTGAALFADISGFTHFINALYQELGSQLGAEELSLQLNQVYEALIEEVHRYGGSVISFSGDAITCWFDGDKGRRATACALDMQKVLLEVEKLSTPAGNYYPLGIKVAVVSGRARRFLVGQPRIQRIEVLAGEILDRMAAAEKQLRSGEVIVGSEVIGRFGNQAIIREWRHDEKNEHFAVLERLTDPILEQPWPDPPDLNPEVSRDWLLPPVYQRLIRGEGEFLSELRSAIAIFIKFQGINYDDDEEAGTKLDAYIGWVQRILAHYEGFLLELTMGDKGSYLFSAFGARVTHEDDVDRALAAAIELRSPPEELGYIHDIQIGISRGKVRVGAYGASTRRNYGAQGPDVNLAARLMDKAGPGQILVSSRIQKVASKHFAFEDLGHFPIKGLDEPVNVFAFTSQLLDITTDILGRSKYPIVGREAEQASLDEGFQALLKGSSTTMIIEGEAGIGKTRLVEYARSQARRSGVRVLVGAGDEIGRSSMYHAWQPVFRQLFNLDRVGGEGEDNYRGERRAQILDMLAELVPGSVHLAPLLNAVLPLDLPDNELTSQMSSEVRANNIRELLVELLSGIVKSTPVLLVLDEGHWLDSASWAMLRLVNRHVQPLMLVIAHRPLVDPLPSEYTEIIAGNNTRHLLLDPLSPSEVERLSCHRLEVNHLPQPVLEFVNEKAEGNPFFSEELIFALRDSGQIKMTDKGVHMDPSPGGGRVLDFPDTIQDVIRSRIDRLTPQEQLALKMASAIGRIFPFRILYDIHPIEADKSHLHDYLDALERLAFCRRISPDPDLSYMFKHIITRDVAYNLMLINQRKVVHRSIAEWYEEAFAADLAQVYSLLAYHWNQTEDSITAVKFLEKAGEQAVHNFANQEAVTFLCAALARADEADLEIEEARRAHWELLLGEAYVNLADYVRGRQHIEAGLALLGMVVPVKQLSQFGGIIWQVLQQTFHRMLPSYYIGRRADKREILLSASRACERLVEVYYVMNETALALYTAFRTLNLAEAAGSSPELARGYGTVGALIGFIPLHGIATSYLHRALDTVEKVDDLIAHVWVNIVVAFYDAGIGNWGDAAQLLEEAVEISERLGDQRRREDGIGVLCALNYFQGNFETSARLSENLIQISRRRNAEQSLAFGLQGIACAMLHQGRFAETEISLKEFQSLLTEDSKISDEALTIEMYGLFSMLYLRVSDPEQALEMAEQSTRLCEKTMPSNFSYISGYVGPVSVYLSLWETGHMLPNIEKKAWKACKLLKKYANVFPIGQPRAWLYQGWYDWLSGKHTKAQKAWNKSLIYAEKLGMCYEQGLAYLEIGRHLPMGEPDRQEDLRKAVEIFSQQRADYDLKRSQQALSEA
jgi:predicted ATPase/class 3 adenylate cyclase